MIQALYIQKKIVLYELIQLELTNYYSSFVYLGRRSVQLG